MNKIATQPTRSDWKAFFISFPSFTCIGAILPMLGVSWLYIDSPQGRAPASALIGCLFFGAALAFWFARRELNRKYWLLTETELVAGKWGCKHLPLSSIKKIIAGSPPLSAPVAGVSKLGFSAAIRERVAQANINALLLIFEDGRLLLLKLSCLDNGPILTNELVNRLADRVVRNHPFTDKEIRFLRPVDPNALTGKKSLQGLF
jgi:hypothetical protein